MDKLLGKRFQTKSVQFNALTNELGKNSVDIELSSTMNSDQSTEFKNINLDSKFDLIKLKKRSPFLLMKISFVLIKMCKCVFQNYHLIF